MNLQYMYCMIFISQVVIIQKYMRTYRMRKKYIRDLHRVKFEGCLKDIFEISLMPPIKGYPLLEKGGYNYREGLQRFQLLIEKI